MRTRLVIAILIALAARPLFADDKPVKASEAERIEQLIRQLGAASFEKRERAGRDLIAIGRPAVPLLRNATKDADLEIVRRAKACIDEIKINEKVAVLTAELKSPDPKTRWAAANTIMLEMRALAKGAVPALIQALDDTDSRVRLQAARALQMIGPSAAPSVPKLLQLLKDQRVDRDLRWQVAIVLKAIGEPARSAVPALLKTLEDQDPVLRNGAAQALGALGRYDKATLPALLRALNAKDGRALGPVGAAVGQLGEKPDTCVRALLDTLRRTTGQSWGADDPRVGLMSGLAQFGSIAKPAISALVKIVADEHESEQVRLAAIITLADIGADAKNDLVKLEKSLRSRVLTFPISKAIERIEADNVRRSK